MYKYYPYSAFCERFEILPPNSYLNLDIGCRKQIGLKANGRSCSKSKRDLK